MDQIYENAMDVLTMDIQPAPQPAIGTGQQRLVELHAELHHLGKRALALQAAGDEAGCAQTVSAFERTLAEALRLIEEVAGDLDPTLRGYRDAQARRVATAVADRLQGRGRPLRPAVAHR